MARLIPLLVLIFVLVINCQSFSPNKQRYERNIFGSAWDWSKNKLKYGVDDYPAGADVEYENLRHELAKKIEELEKLPLWKDIHRLAHELLIDEEDYEPGMLNQISIPDLKDLARGRRLIDEYEDISF